MELKHNETISGFKVIKKIVEGDADRITISSSGKEDLEDGVKYAESWKRRVVILNILSA